MEQLPSIFLSSTFFDLGQIRADVAHFVESQLGYRFLASEYPTFPVEPQVDAVENCRRRVEQDADIFVLLIGNRYGTVPVNARHSVTNLEYNSARAKNVPIFAFIHRDLLAALRVWKVNPEANFDDVVDTPRLFEFVEQVREADGVWTFPFDTAHDVIGALRTQLAYEMNRGLDYTKRFRADQTDLSNLHGNALRIAIDRPRGWQPLLIAELLEDGFASTDHIRRNYANRLTVPGAEHVLNTAMGDWISAKSDEATRIITELSSVVLETLTRASEQSDIRTLKYGASAVVASYVAAMEWSTNIRSAHVPMDWNGVAQAMAEYLDLSIATLCDLPRRLRDEISRLSVVSGNVRGTVHMKFDVDPRAQERFHAEMKVLRKKHGFG